MSNAGVNIKDIKKELLLDDSFKKKYSKLQPRYEIIAQIIEARKENNISQSELARRIGTQKSNISRLESGNYNPSLDLLIKVADALGKDLQINMQ